MLEASTQGLAEIEAKAKKIEDEQDNCKICGGNHGAFQCWYAEYVSQQISGAWLFGTPLLRLFKTNNTAK